MIWIWNAEEELDLRYQGTQKLNILLLRYYNTMYVNRIAYITVLQLRCIATQTYTLAARVITKRK